MAYASFYGNIPFFDQTFQFTSFLFASLLLTAILKLLYTYLLLYICMYLSIDLFIRDRCNTCNNKYTYNTCDNKRYELLICFFLSNAVLICTTAIYINVMELSILLIFSLRHTCNTCNNKTYELLICFFFCQILFLICINSVLEMNKCG